MSLFTCTQVSDEGVYTCLATNKAGDVSVNITLNVFIPPSISTTGLSPNSSVVLGLQTAIDCPAKGKPTPQIKWYRVSVVKSCFLKVILRLYFFDAIMYIV